MIATSSSLKTYVSNYEVKANFKQKTLNYFGKFLGNPKRAEIIHRVTQIILASACLVPTAVVGIVVGAATVLTISISVTTVASPGALVFVAAIVGAVAAGIVFIPTAAFVLPAMGFVALLKYQYHFQLGSHPKLYPLILKEYSLLENSQAMAPLQKNQVSTKMEIYYLATRITDKILKEDLKKLYAEFFRKDSNLDIDYKNSICQFKKEKERLSLKKEEIEKKDFLSQITIMTTSQQQLGEQRRKEELAKLTSQAEALQGLIDQNESNYSTQKSNIRPTYYNKVVEKGFDFYKRFSFETKQSSVLAFGDYQVKFREKMKSIDSENNLISLQACFLLQN